MEQKAKQFRKRNAILAGLRQTKSHPSAEALYAMLKPEIPDLSIGTVYRNLNLFKEQGLIISVGTVNGVERFDGNASPHVHFVCTDCGSVLDLEEMVLPPSLTQAAERCCGGQIDACQLTFSGLCRNCINQEKERGELA